MPPTAQHRARRNGPPRGFSGSTEEKTALQTTPFRTRVVRRIFHRSCDPWAEVTFEGRAESETFARRDPSDAKRAMHLMKIATYNINGVRRRLDNLLQWLDEAKPDVACLQEIKCANAEFPQKALEAAGYGSVWHGQGPHHGVAILARDSDPLETRRTLPGDPDDREARYIEAAVSGVLIGCLYLPNGNPQPGPKFVYKLAWFERLAAHAAALQISGAPVVLAGDYNVVPTDADIYALRSWRTNALVQPEARAAFARLCEAGWTDALNELHAGEALYTFWDYLRDAWSRNAGMRIDHLLLSRSLAQQLVRAGVDRDVRGRKNASDHAPAWIELQR